MKVILLDEIKGKGGEGDVIDVAQGYAENCLIPKKLGVEVDRKRVELGKPIKVAGSYQVEISLYRDIKAEVTVLVGVEALEEEAAPEEVVDVEVEASAEETAEDAE